MLKKSNRKVNLITFRLSDDELSILNREAKRLNLTRSKYISQKLFSVNRKTNRPYPFQKL